MAETNLTEIENKIRDKQWELEPAYESVWKSYADDDNLPRFTAASVMGAWDLFYENNDNLVSRVCAFPFAAATIAVFGSIGVIADGVVSVIISACEAGQFVWKFPQTIKNIRRNRKIKKEIKELQNEKQETTDIERVLKFVEHDNSALKESIRENVQKTQKTIENITDEDRKYLDAFKAFYSVVGTPLKTSKKVETSKEETLADGINDAEEIQTPVSKEKATDAVAANQKQTHASRAARM